MIDGDRTAVSVQSSQAVKRAVARAYRSWGGFRAWHELESEDRLALVELALTTPANNSADELPLAS